jgi:hypothetical protein
VQPRDKLYKPKNNLVPCSNSLCQAVSTGENYHCDAPDDQCDYEIEYADLGSSIGVLLSDSFPLRLTNGTLLQPKMAFGCVSCIPPQLTHRTLLVLFVLNSTQLSFKETEFLFC